MSSPSRIDAAAVGLHQAHDRIEAGRLAGAVGAEQADHLAAVDVERDVVEHRALVVGLGDRADLEPAVRLPRLGGRAREGRGLVHLLVLLLLLALRDGEVAGDPAAARIDAGRPAVDHRAAGVEVDHQPRAVDLVGVLR